MLWRDLATWLRSYKVSLFGGVGNSDELSRRCSGSLRIRKFFEIVFRRSTYGTAYVFIDTQYIAILQLIVAAQINNEIDKIII
jgi:hypothetical protein